MAEQTPVNGVFPGEYTVPGLGKVEYVLNSATATPPVRFHPGDAGYDLVVSRSAMIDPGDFIDVHTDIEIALPPDLWGRIVGRSSTFRKMRLQVIDGVVDCGFRGELRIGVLSHARQPIVIEQGWRLAQFILHPLIIREWRKTGLLGYGERGTDGYGSTGIVAPIT